MRFHPEKNKVMRIVPGQPDSTYTMSLTGDTAELETTNVAKDLGV